jgi:hypothetical protein
MSKKPIADLGGLVQVDTPEIAREESHTLAPRRVPKPRKAATIQLRKAGFLVHPKALQQFDVLKAELAGENRRNIGPRLLNEALNLLFEKYGKPLINLDL